MPSKKAKEMIQEADDLMAAARMAMNEGDKKTSDQLRLEAKDLYAAAAIEEEEYPDG